ncbi:hypothetical protein HRE53_27045 (plasmid) [Acaryochloris sp. 'Moss Beach']|uniref:hypothetical protein n=1 Tax=Acaryochloris TaxID=155977 RepID=UPI001BAF67D8|nr:MULTISPECIES: hypothetical protein [Acaryochloris]QUY40403.1 hypothetical protein I1H34_00455 [Acaryochloris marina S15]UJB72518.1 hypothetical protein HRE53_27045 [Acaryochloris sp. 'Moss Beach']
MLCLASFLAFSEGLFVLTLPEILEYLDFKVYVETPDDLRMNRRIIRDGTEKLR